MDLVKLIYCAAQDNVADLMIKPLEPGRMIELRSLAGLENPECDEPAQHTGRGGVLFTNQRNATQVCCKGLVPYDVLQGSGTE